MEIFVVRHTEPIDLKVTLFLCRYSETRSAPLTALSRSELPEKVPYLSAWKFVSVCSGTAMFAMSGPRCFLMGCDGPWC
jgi:hypothetical protein